MIKMQNFEQTNWIAENWKKNDDSMKSFVTIDRREFAIMKIIVDFNEKLNADKKLNDDEKLNVIDST